MELKDFWEGIRSVLLALLGNFTRILYRKKTTNFTWNLLLGEVLGCVTLGVGIVIAASIVGGIAGSALSLISLIGGFALATVLGRFAKGADKKADEVMDKLFGSDDKKKGGGS